MAAVRARKPPMDDGVLARAVLFAAQRGYAADIAPMASLNTTMRHHEELWKLVGPLHHQHGRTNLAAAAKRGDVARVTFLIDKCKVDVEAADEMGKTALHWGAESGREAAVRQLLDAEADLEARTRQQATPLMTACAKGYNKLVQLFIDEGADPGARDGTLRRPLHYAIEHGHADVAALLLQAHADPDAQDARRRAPIHVCCELARQDVASKVVALLHKYGANLDCGEAGGNAPLHVVATRGNAQLCQILIDAGADIGALNALSQQPLHLAAAAGNEAVVTCLLAAGAEPASGGLTPLTLAIANRHESVAIKLVDHGGIRPVSADASADSDAVAPLGAACQHALTALVDKLLGLGANPNKKDIRNYTPLMRVCKANLLGTAWRLRIIEALLAKGALIDTRDQRGATPLHDVAFHPELMRALVKYGGAPVDVTDWAGNTPLHRAVEGAHWSVRYLVEEAKANVDATNHAKETPLHVAAAFGDKDSVACLVKEGRANVDARDQQERTPLIRSCIVPADEIADEDFDADDFDERRLPVVDTLIKSGASVNAANENGWTPLHYSAVRGLTLIARRLLEAGADIDAKLKGPDGATPVGLAMSNDYDDLADEMEQYRH